VVEQAAKETRVVRELRGGEIYEYVPLGEHVVAASGVCGGRPTFKYTRIEAAGALNLLAAGYAIDQIARRFEIPDAAVTEAIRLAGARLDALRPTPFL
jgi:uncharacterized protein (DUF433 family)